MKNIKVTYRYTNPSRILNNLLLQHPDDTSKTEVFEYQNLTDETADRIVKILNSLDFVADFVVTNFEPLVKKELTASAVG